MSAEKVESTGQLALSVRETVFSARKELVGEISYISTAIQWLKHGGIVLLFICHVLLARKVICSDKEDCSLVPVLMLLEKVLTRECAFSFKEEFGHVDLFFGEAMFAREFFTCN
ncbi:MAG: hypothetical protein NZ807_01960 [Dehalococcoidia bacterium]|nr:hypothetical protein [Dehalococcoidia bacterium]